MKDEKITQLFLLTFSIHSFLLYSSTIQLRYDDYRRNNLGYIELVRKTDDKIDVLYNSSEKERIIEAKEVMDLN